MLKLKPNNMKDQLVSLETAQRAAEKGFSIVTEKCYCKNYMDTLRTDSVGNDTPGTIFSCYAPTQSLLQKWLREKHNLHIYIETTPSFDKIQGNKWEATVKYCFQPFKWTTAQYDLADTYEAVLEKGLFRALSLIDLKTK